MYRGQQLFWPIGELGRFASWPSHSRIVWPCREWAGFPTRPGTLADWRIAAVCGTASTSNEPNCSVIYTRNYAWSTGFLHLARIFAATTNPLLPTLAPCYSLDILQLAMTNEFLFAITPTVLASTTSCAVPRPPYRLRLALGPRALAPARLIGRLRTDIRATHLCLDSRLEDDWDDERPRGLRTVVMMASIVRARPRIAALHMRA